VTDRDRRRVVITGMGALTPLGNDPEAFWSRLAAGESGVRPIASFDPSRLTSRIAGEVQAFDSSAVLDRKEQRRNDRATQFALVAARQAMDQAGLPERLEGTLAEETGANIASGLGGSATLFSRSDLHQRGPDRSALLRARGHRQHAAGQVAIMTGPGPTSRSALRHGRHATRGTETILRAMPRSCSPAAPGRRSSRARRRLRGVRALDAQRRPPAPAR
jgi:3-oxoacyl-(acyl-carrier-protein) synthase